MKFFINLHKALDHMQISVLWWVTMQHMMYAECSFFEIQKGLKFHRKQFNIKINVILFVNC